MADLTDTSPDVEQKLREVLRAMPAGRKWQQVANLYDTARIFHAAGFRARHPSASEEQIAAAWRMEVSSVRCPPERKAAPMSQPHENLLVLREVIAILDRLGIGYAIAGSWASMFWGKFRFTHDADLTVEPFPGREKEFCDAFGEDYYLSLDAVSDANRRRASFNVLHTPSGFKVDLFVRKDRPFEVSAFSRRQSQPLSEVGEAVYLVRPEDIILYKLEWYRLGNHTSDQQWRDVLGVVQVQAERLDRPYLEKWAADLGVADLWQKAWQEAGVG
jgi:hypothetical protein